MFRWIGLALLGIVVAAAVSVAASRLASQQIGLASQPVSAGDALVPAAERRTGRVEHRHAHANARAHRHQRAKEETMPGKAAAGTTSAPRDHPARTTSPAPSPAAPAPEARPAPAPSQPTEPNGGEEGEPSGPDD